MCLLLAGICCFLRHVDNGHNYDSVFAHRTKGKVETEPSISRLQCLALASIERLVWNGQLVDHVCLSPLHLARRAGSYMVHLPTVK